MSNQEIKQTLIMLVLQEMGFDIQSTNELRNYDLNVLRRDPAFHAAIQSLKHRVQMMVN
jgi:hypothetical protein